MIDIDDLDIDYGNALVKGPVFFFKLFIHSFFPGNLRGNYISVISIITGLLYYLIYLGCRKMLY